MSRVLFFLTALLLLATGVSAQLPVSADASYLIGPRDRLQIRVVELPELNSDVEVGAEGTITLPVIGAVSAGGLTVDLLAERIRNRLQNEGLRRATVSVAVTSLRTEPVRVLGAVMNPGPVQIPGRTQLLDVLLQVGGLGETHSNRIRIRRQADNGLSDQVEVSVDDLIMRADARVNLPIFPGDLIHVPAAEKVEIHLLGEVKTTGTLEFLSTDRVTLLTAIARAGGLTDTASNRIRILRRDADGKQDEITVDYRGVLGGNDADIELLDGDIVLVKESFF
ncbi:MAG: polysaccharide biosynthesis/export family protein [Acidobacteriota bacterium]